jgi:hypothetical protein
MPSKSASVVPWVRHIQSAITPLPLAVFLFAGAAHAQVDQGSVSGTITDASGAVIPGAKVTLVDAGTNLTFTRTTSSGGVYTFTPIKVGRYSLKVDAPGFQSVLRENIHVDVSQSLGINLSLKPGSETETVTVTAQPDLQTEDASTGQVFNTQTISDTPLVGRNYVFIAQLTTGVAAPNQGFGQVAGAGDFTSNGNRVSQNNFVLDGVDNNSNMQDFLNGATYAVRPPPDALSEFKVQSSDYSAELGHSTGAAINAAIKSGTNQFHGSLWEYYRNDRLDAIDYFNTGKTAYHQNIFGATLGGPIFKDKIFFFADAQGTRTSQFIPAQKNNTVPTDAERNGDFSQLLDAGNTNGNGTIPLYMAGGNSTAGPGQTEAPGVQQRYLTCNGAQNVICAGQINPIAQRILKLFPEPNQGNPNQVLQNYTIPATSNLNDTTQYDLRVDYNFSSKDQMFGRYSYSNNPSSSAPPFGILDGGGFGSGGHDANYAKSGVFSETHFFSPTLSNEFRVGYNWLLASYLQQNSNTDIAAQLGLGGIPFGPNLGGMPDIGFGGYVNSIGVAGYVPSDEKQNVLQILDNVSKVWGPHSVKFGIDFQHVRFFGLQPPNGLGSENFSGTYTSDPGAPTTQATGSGAADFLLDDMNSSSITSDTPFTNLRWYYSAFAQDDWKVNSKLTLNLGLRWEYAQPIHELHDEQANFIGNFNGLNQGSGTYLIPASQRAFPLPAALTQAFASDNITVQYTSDRSLVQLKKLNFAPRVGIAYAFTPRTVLRAGGGLFYGGLENIGLGLNLANNAPFFVSANFNPVPNVCQNVNGAISCPTNGQTLESGFSSALNAPGGLVNYANLPTIYATDQNSKSSYVTAYNLSLQQAVSNSISYTVSYQGNQSRRLRSDYNANQYPGVLPSGANGQLYQPFYDLGSVVLVRNEGIARYDSLQAKLDKRYTNGLYFLAGYTWSHCLDDAFGPIGQSEYGGYRNPNLLGFRYDYGACTQDVRNRFTFSPQYQLPFGAGKRFLNRGGITNQVVGGWKTSFIFQTQTGNPIFLNSTNQGSSFPIRSGDPFAAGGTPDAVTSTQPNFQCASKTRTLDHWFNPCAFRNAPTAVVGANPAQNQVEYAQAGLQPFGPKGRVDVSGPGFYQLDMSLFKSFAIPEHHTSLEVRGDGFNILNHPTFGNPNSGLTGSSAGQITSTRFSTLIPNARVFELSAKLEF